MEGAAQLLDEIAHCPIARACLAGDPDLPCYPIVSSQGATAEHFQAPEPWSGHLQTAPILFLSSNPSLGADEVYPTACSWPTSRVVDFFDARFEQREEPWVDTQMRALRTDGAPRSGRGTRFWIACRARASELLGRDATPGIDYAFAEVVHCKSKDEHGVAEALAACAELWLSRLLDAAEARVVVLFGSRARTAIERVYHVTMTLEAPLSRPIEIEGHTRLLVALPHLNARVRRRNCSPLTREQLADVHVFLGDGTGAPRASEVPASPSTEAALLRAFDQLVVPLCRSGWTVARRDVERSFGADISALGELARGAERIDIERFPDGSSQVFPGSGGGADEPTPPLFAAENDLECTAEFAARGWL